MLILYHIASFSIGVLLDFLIGDPHWMPHPIRLIGRLIGWLDKKFMDSEVQGHEFVSGVNNRNLVSGKSKVNSKCRNNQREIRKGAVCACVVVLLTFGITALLVVGGYLIHSVCGIIIESILTAYCLATKSLKTESMKVYKALCRGDLEGARYAVSMIVGRDTASLDDVGITKAAVETVAENTSDGVVAPMMYLIIGGPVLGMTYKAINTMDSMIGYHNERYEFFGKVAAKLDDVVNFIPSRLSALLMIFVSFLGRDFDGKNAWRIWRRDRYNHKSPNSAQTESVCAGALRVQLAGDAYYFGKLVRKPFIGDALREIEIEDIRRANGLMYRAVLLLFFVAEVVMAILYVLVL